MVIVLQLPLCLYELQGFVVCVDDCFLLYNVMLPLPTGLHNGIHLFVIGVNTQVVPWLLKGYD